MRLNNIVPGIEKSKFLKTHTNASTHVVNGDYESYKLNDISIEGYNIHIVFYFFQHKLTHYQIFPSSKDLKDINGLEKIRTEVDNLQIWSSISLIDDSKMGYTYLIAK